MEIALQILLGIVAFICMTGGINLFIKGVGYFLPENTDPQTKLDNVFRFLSGMYFSFGFILIWIILHIETTTHLIYLIGVVVLCAALGRLYSSIKLGSAGENLDRIMFMEIAIGIGIMLLQYFR